MRASSAIALLLNGTRHTLRGLLDVLYPPRCMGCSAKIRHEDGPLCPRCLRRMERADPEEVRARLAHLPQQGIERGFALWLFDKDGTLQRIQHALKYGNRPHCGVGLGTLVGHAYQETFGAAARPDAVLPVPLHRARLYERGYNQSAMLARGVSHALRVRTEEGLLHRHRRTRSQTKLSRPARWQNVDGAFSVSRPGTVAGAHLLLVDDVLTTGATAGAAACALLGAGAHSVSVATLAFARS